MKRKAIHLIMCIALLASLAFGCADNRGKLAGRGTSEGRYKDFITVDVYDEFANYQGIQSGWFAKVVKDKFQMELNYIAQMLQEAGIRCTRRGQRLAALAI